MSNTAYYELKAALALFGRDASSLEGADRERVQSVARRYVQIEAVVLASDEAQGVCLAPDAVASSLEEIRGSFPEVEAFNAAMDAVGLSETALSAALQRDLLVEAVLSRVGSRAGEVGRTEAEIFYLNHRERFHSPERRTARHILITVNEDYTDNTRERVQHRIKEIARRLGNKPERFEEQAAKHSECPTALNGGLLGEVPRGHLYPELDEVLFALQPGELSAPVESELGFHLVRCDAINPERTLSFEEVADSLCQRLTEERTQRDAKRWLTALLKRQTDTVAAG